jgi:hypothetical protein
MVGAWNPGGSMVACNLTTGLFVDASMAYRSQSRSIIDRAYSNTLLRPIWFLCAFLRPHF